MNPIKNHSDSSYVDREKLESAREIIHLLVKTFSQAKIFSADHRNVKEFIDQLFRKLKEYLNLYRTFEIGIEESSFTLEGNVFYTDKDLSHSLPFLFFKDGMKMLYFYPDLEKQEFMNFLEIIKSDAVKPVEESDIVSAFWERDFANIRYFAPDEYLESKIGLDSGTLDYTVDKQKLFSGKIELDVEDRKALSESHGLVETVLANKEQKIAVEESESEDRPHLPILTPSEMLSLESMLESNRRASPDHELISLLFEMIQLEKRPREFSQNLEILKHCLQKIIMRGDFSRVLETFNTLIELRDENGSAEEERRAEFDRLIAFFQSEETLSELKKLVEKGLIQEKSAFLEYLKILGPKSLPFLSDLFQMEQNPLIKNHILNLIKELGRTSPNILARLARDDDPHFTLEIISVVKELEARQAVSHLTRLLRFSNKKIRAAAIRALSEFKLPTVESILVGSINDPDENIRILALKHLTYLEGEKTLERVLPVVNGKDFEKKSRREKQAFFRYLASTQHPKAWEAFLSISKKIGLFTRPDLIDTALAAVAVLSRTDIPEAEKILHRFSRCRQRKIREACRAGLNTGEN